MTVTEIAQLTIKPGGDVNAAGTEVYEAKEFAFKTISEQAGVKGIWYGLQVENPNILELMVEWEDLSYHEKFIAMGEEIYKPFVSRIQSSLISSEPNSLVLNHVKFRTPFIAVVSAPVIEMVTMYLPSDCDPASVEKTMDEFFAVVDRSAEGHVGNTHGWVLEELEYEKVEGKAKGYYFAIGWESIDMHMKYRETQAFKDSVPLIREVGKGTSMHHTSFTKWSS